MSRSTVHFAGTQGSRCVSGFYILYVVSVQNMLFPGLVVVYCLMLWFLLVVLHACF